MSVKHEASNTRQAYWELSAKIRIRRWSLYGHRLCLTTSEPIHHSSIYYAKYQRLSVLPVARSLLQQGTVWSYHMDFVLPCKQYRIIATPLNIFWQGLCF